MLALTFAAAIVAESALVRSGLAAILGASPAIQVVAEAAPRDANQLSEAGIDLVVCDVADDAATPELPATPDGVPVLALVGAPERAGSLLRAGVKGIIARDSSADRVAAASVAVASGLWAIDSATFESLMSASTVPLPILPPAEPDYPALTPREREVLELLAEGLSNKLIALRLDISEHTAKFHVNSILDKLNADTRTDAVVRAAKGGLITL